VEGGPDKTKGAAEAAVEKPKELAQEAARGGSERTPWIALSGVTIVVAVLVAVVLTIAFLLYFLV